MASFRTGDRATDQNLELLGQLSVDHGDYDRDHFLDLVRAVIGIDKMLPYAVKRHFKLPFLWVGDGPYRWGDVQVRERTIELRTALASGLAKVRADPLLVGGNGVTKADRPQTRCEQIESALQAYREIRGPAEFQALRLAVSGTSLQHKVEELERWLKRKRPSPGGRPIEYEIVSVLGDIGRHADCYAHLPATDFENE